MSFSINKSPRNCCVAKDAQFRLSVFFVSDAMRRRPASGARRRRSDEIGESLELQRTVECAALLTFESILVRFRCCQTMMRYQHEAESRIFSVVLCRFFFRFKARAQCSRLFAPVKRWKTKRANEIVAETTLARFARLSIVTSARAFE